MSMNVSLTPMLEQFVDTKVKSGRYNSASEVLREALRLLIEHDHVQELQRKQLNAKIDEGLAAATRGELIDGKDAMAKLHRREEEMRRKKKAA